MHSLSKVDLSLSWENSTHKNRLSRHSDNLLFSLLCLFVALVVSHFDFGSDRVSSWSLLSFYFFGNKKQIYYSESEKQRQGSACMDALKILSSLMFVHEYMMLLIKLLVLHVEFHLFFSKIRF